MLRKISASEETLGVVGTFCVEAKEIEPTDPPPESLETEGFGGRPRPPVVVIGEDRDFGVNATFNEPPNCPVPTRRSFFNPLTQQVEYYYDYGFGVTEVPPECGGGINF